MSQNLNAQKVFSTTIFWAEQCIQSLICRMLIKSKQIRTGNRKKLTILIKTDRFLKFLDVTSILLSFSYLKKNMHVLPSTHYCFLYNQALLDVVLKPANSTTMTKEKIRKQTRLPCCLHVDTTMNV